MKPAATKMCSECPFSRTAAPGYLGAATPEDFIDSTLHSEGDMPCHLTVDYEDENWRDKLVDAKRCRGSLVFLRNTCKLPRRPELADAVSRVTADRQQVFSHRAEFLDHHTNTTWLKEPHVVEVVTAQESQVAELAGLIKVTQKYRNRRPAFVNVFLTESWELFVVSIAEPHQSTMDRLNLKNDNILLSGCIVDGNILQLSFRYTKFMNTEPQQAVNLQAAVRRCLTELINNGQLNFEIRKCRNDDSNNKKKTKGKTRSKDGSLGDAGTVH